MYSRYLQLLSLWVIVLPKFQSHHVTVTQHFLQATTYLLLMVCHLEFYHITAAVTSVILVSLCFPIMTQTRILTIAVAIAVAIAAITSIVFSCYMALCKARSRPNFNTATNSESTAPYPASRACSNKYAGSCTGRIKLPRFCLGKVSGKRFKGAVEVTDFHLYAPVRGNCTKNKPFQSCKCQRVKISPTKKKKQIQVQFQQLGLCIPQFSGIGTSSESDSVASGTFDWCRQHKNMTPTLHADLAWSCLSMSIFTQPILLNVLASPASGGWLLKVRGPVKAKADHHPGKKKHSRWNEKTCQKHTKTSKNEKIHGG